MYSQFNSQTTEKDKNNSWIEKPLLGKNDDYQSFKVFQSPISLFSLGNLNIDINISE